MSKLLAATGFMIAALLAAQAAAAEPARPSICPGVRVAAFEARMPDAVSRFAFEGRSLDPFLTLWQAGRRPRLPLPPESVTVYAVPGRPYLVGYQREGCVLAFLAVERSMLRQLLRSELGWPA